MKKTSVSVSDESIAAALLECRTRAEAAEKLGISPRTLYDRMQSYSLQSILSVLRADQLKTRLKALETAEQTAIDTVISIMTDESANTGDRLKACGMILEAGRAARQEIGDADSLAVTRLRNAEKLDNERKGILDFSPMMIE